MFYQAKKAESNYTVWCEYCKDVCRDAPGALYVGDDHDEIWVTCPKCNNIIISRHEHMDSYLRRQETGDPEKKKPYECIHRNLISNRILLAIRKRLR